MYQTPQARENLSVCMRHYTANGHYCFFTVVLAFACAAGILLGTGDALARGRSNYGRSAAAAVKAQRARMVSSLQQQVSSARQILQKAESQSQMTQADLNAATSKLSGIREEIDNTHQDAVEAAKTLRAIEAELILHQARDSEYAKTQATVDQLKNTVHETIHQVLNLPMQELKPGSDPRNEDLKRLSITQLSTLRDNQTFIDAENSLKDAIQNLSRIRQKLLQSDSDWVAAHEDLINANHDKLDGEKARRLAGSAAAGKRQELQNVKNVAQTAQSIIASGEQRLRQLGASVPQQKTKSESSTSRRK